MGDNKKKENAYDAFCDYILPAVVGQKGNDAKLNHMRVVYLKMLQLVMRHLPSCHLRMHGAGDESPRFTDSTSDSGGGGGS
jgi:hypothetical protein